MKKIYNEVIESKILDLKFQIKQMKLLSNIIPKWSKPIPINEQHSKHSNGITKAIGVYKIIHAPTNKLMAIGQGNVSARRTRHLQIFKNKGLAVTYKNGGADQSQTGSKMYRFDRNINNWLFTWCDCSNKQIAIELEHKLINKLKPAFNLETMAGVN